MERPPTFIFYFFPDRTEEAEEERGLFPVTISDLPRLEYLRFIEDVRSGFAQKVSYTPWVAYLFVREADG